MSSKEQTDKEFIESIALKLLKRVFPDAKDEVCSFVEVDDDEIHISMMWLGYDDKFTKQLLGDCNKRKSFLDELLESTCELSYEEAVEHKANTLKHLRRYIAEVEKWEIDPD